MSMNDQSNLQLGQFDPESQPFGPFRPPTETESQLQNATHAFIRPPRSGESANNFITTSQSTQQHPGHPSNGVASHLQPQGQSCGLDQSQDYNNGVAHAANMSGALHGATAGQMAPPASLSQNELAMGNNAHQTQNNSLTLQSQGQPFQPDFIELDTGSTDSVAFNGPGELQGFKVVPNPPNLDYWRDRLFNVDEMITLSEEEYAGSIVGMIDTLLEADSHISTDSKPTSPTLTMYTLIAPPSGTSVNPSSPITGTVDSKDDHPEPPNPTTQKKRSASVRPENGISAMLKSKSWNTSQCPKYRICPMQSSPCHLTSYLACILSL